MKPILAFTSGDPGGIGPEVAVRALLSRKVRRACRPVLVGPRKTFWKAGWRPGLAPLIDIGGDQALTRGSAASVLRRKAARISYEAFLHALRLASRKAVAGMVTAPVSKEAWRLAGIRYPDQTALMREETGAPRAGMMLLGAGLRAVLATRHIPLHRACKAVGYKAVKEAAGLARDALRHSLGVPRPVLGLCALNPHAGEGGLIGTEERSRLGPAAVRLRRQGFRIDGPIPADAAWAAHAAGRYDALIALYHDQALIPLKLAAGYGVVNWTIGVGVVRTAPGHGTAMDIAGKGKADPKGMIEAALLAARLAARS